MQEYLVAVFESADVVYGGLHGSGAKIGNTAYESVSACAINEVVLDVAGSSFAFSVSPVAKVLMRARAFSMFVMLISF